MTIATWLATGGLVLSLLAGPASAQPSTSATAAPGVVELLLDGSRILPFMGASQALALEEAVCRVEVVPTGVRVTALRRGESVVFVWYGERRTEILVRVSVKSVAAMSAAGESASHAPPGQGELGTTVQAALEPGGGRTYFYQHEFGWSEAAGGRKLSARGQLQDLSVPGAPLNVTAASMQYETPHAALTLLDFGLTLNGGASARVTSAAPLNSYVFRGAQTGVTLGRSQLQGFAGTSIPSYYRSLRGTQAIGGLNIGRQQTSRLFLYGTVASVGAPPAPPGVTAVRARSSQFATAGLAYRVGDRWAAQGTAGVSNRGLYGDGALAFTRDHLAVWVAGASSSAEFPLNQLQLLSAGGTSGRGSVNWQPSKRVTTALFFQQSVTRPTPLFQSFGGESRYFNPTVSVRLFDGQSLTLSGAHSRSVGGPAGDGAYLTRSVNASWTAQWSGRLVNSLRLSAITADDPRQLTSGRRMSVGDDVNVRFARGYLTIGVQRHQQDPSLAVRLRQQLALLPGSLQERFLADPVGFVQSPDLPSDVRDLLSAIRAADTAFSVAAQFQPARRLNVSLNYGLLESVQGSGSSARSNTVGYTLAWQVTDSFQLHSSLSEMYVVDPRRNDLARTTSVVVGGRMAFRGSLGWLMPSATHPEIRGSVFVDRNVNGSRDPDESGLAGVEVRLADGRRAVTDHDGRYRFANLKSGIHRASMSLAQFPDPVRMTTLTTASVDLYARPQAEVDFGIVNFARVLGNVYNDYRHDRVKQADSPGLQKVAVIVTDAAGVTRRVVSDGAGEFRLDDLPPGTYQVIADAETLPANYVADPEPRTFQLKATRTVTVDVPVHAIRTVSGHVYLEASSREQGQPARAPASGLTVTAGGCRATTDTDGRFVLRNLPAGDVLVTLAAATPLPPGMSAPTGMLRLPKEPVRVDEAVIVIRSVELLRHFEQPDRQR